MASLKEKIEVELENIEGIPQEMPSHNSLPTLVNLFTDKSIEPDANSLATVLGETGIFWQEIKKHIQDEYGDVKEEWKFYYQKYGWILQVIRKKRTIFWLKPFKDYFSNILVWR